MATAPGHPAAIPATRVIGTYVQDEAGNRIGHIEDIVLDKASNNIMFAVVGFGGFLGMLGKFHALPWSSLSYDDARHSYVVSYSKEQLRGAPAASVDELTRGGGAPIRELAYDYYHEPRYWEHN